MKMDNRILDRIAQFVCGLVEGRDPGLSTHHNRVSEHNEAFGGVLGLSRDEINVLRIAGHIHDIGKMSVSEHILYKPAPLTATEWFLMKQHTILGKHLLEPLNLAPEILSIVAWHHENADGSGYPDGLAGDSIPLYARITRIVDSFDALTVDRPYHRGVSPKMAMSILQRDARFYDRDLLEAFSSVVKDEVIAAPLDAVGSTSQLVT